MRLGRGERSRSPRAPQPRSKVRTVSELSGKRVVVVGLGSSGVAAARLCLRRGARVVANDSKPREALSDAALALANEGATLVLGGHAAAGIAETDVVVVSPGVPQLPELAAAAERGIPIWSEIE